MAELVVPQADGEQPGDFVNVLPAEVAIAGDAKIRCLPPQLHEGDADINRILGLAEILASGSALTPEFVLRVRPAPDARGRGRTAPAMRTNSIMQKLLSSWCARALSAAR